MNEEINALLSTFICVHLPNTITFKGKMKHHNLFKTEPIKNSYSDFIITPQHAKRPFCIAKHCFHNQYSLITGYANGGHFMKTSTLVGGDNYHCSGSSLNGRFVFFCKLWIMCKIVQHHDFIGKFPRSSASFCQQNSWFSDRFIPSAWWTETFRKCFSTTNLLFEKIPSIVHFCFNC